MDIKNIIDELFNNKSVQSSYVMIETLIFRVLTKYSEDNHKKLFMNYGFKNHPNKPIFQFDAYAPDGVSNYQGSTAFELKAYKNKNSLRDLRNIYYDLIGRIKSFDLEVKNLIFIVTLELSEIEKNKIINGIDNGSGINIALWDLNDLQKIFDMYPKVVSSTLENISELVLNNQIYESINEQSENDQTEEHINKLKRSFSDDKLVLFLGAGISKDAKIPMWDDLVSDLLVSLLSNKLKEFKIELTETERDYIILNLKKSNVNSPLLMARYIRQGLKELFIETLSQILYKSCINESELLNSITKLCKPVRNGVGVRGVVNYNFDDLLEYNFRQNDINYRSIFREGDIPTSDELGIFHVHGFLPRDGEDPYLAKSLLVFSEEGYHNLMLDPYSWSNLIQLNYLRENTCLFVGLSMTDPNLRRLLDIASRKQESNVPKHYVILKREKYYKKDLEAHNMNLSSIQKFDTANQKLQEEYYKELGLNVIWIDNFNQIADILDKVRG